MPARILWLDNDLSYLESYIDVLQEENYKVKVVTTLTDAEQELKTQAFDLLILDVMIPTKGPLEEDHYKPQDTEKGAKTGLLFYLQNKDTLQKSATRVLVMTVRLDEAIVKQFISAGLARDCFVTKYQMRDISVFMDKIATHLRANRD